VKGIAPIWLCLRLISVILAAFLTGQIFEKTGQNEQKSWMLFRE
jgi:hypothetical protein